MGPHHVHSRRATLRWLRNRDLRPRHHRVRVILEGDRLLALARGRRWWRHFLRPGLAVLRTRRRELSVWVSIDPHHPPRRDLIRRWQVVLVLDPPDARRRDQSPPLLDLRDELDLRDHPSPEVARAPTPRSRLASRATSDQDRSDRR